METLALSEAMLQEFQDGCLAPLRKYVCADDTLTMRFLGRQVEVDYRGQVIIKVWQIGNKYSVYTMPFFNRYLDPAEGDNMDKILSLIPHYKNATDDLLWEDPDTVRELRQRMERINNRSTATSRQTDYYMVASDYRRAQTDSPKAPGVDVVALKGFVGEDDTDIPKLSVALIQMCREMPVPSMEEQVYWDTDLETAMQGYMAAADVLDKAHLALTLAEDEKWLKELRDNVAGIFRQKCELGLIDRYLEPDAVIEIEDGTPEIDLVAIDTNPRQIGLSSQLFRLSVEDKDGKLAVFRGAPMGMALFEDYRIPLERYLDERPVPKRRRENPNSIDAEDAARLQAAGWLLERVRERLDEGGNLDWEMLGRCLSRMEAFIVQLQRREQLILDSLGEGGNERLEKAISHIVAAEDVLASFEQLDVEEMNADTLSDELRAAATVFIQSAQDALRSALGEYDLPEVPEEDVAEIND